MMIHWLGALPGTGFSTRSVMLTTSSSSVGWMAAQPDRDHCSGANRLRAHTLAPLDHPGQQRVPRVDEVAAEQHRERLVADMTGRAQHGVTEAARVALAHAVKRGQLGGRP